MTYRLVAIGVCGAFRTTLGTATGDIAEMARMAFSVNEARRHADTIHDKIWCLKKICVPIQVELSSFFSRWGCPPSEDLGLRERELEKCSQSQYKSAKHYWRNIKVKGKLVHSELWRIQEKLGKVESASKAQGHGRVGRSPTREVTFCGGSAEKKV